MDFNWLFDPTALAALATLFVMEIVLGIDNLVFISILSNKLPPAQRAKARRIGIGLAVLMRLALLGMIAIIVGLTQPVISLFEHAFSWRDIILISGGFFLVWKATKEIHHAVDPSPTDDVFDTARAAVSFGAVVVQILLLDIVFSLDSIITAVGMTDNIAIMVIAVIATVIVMLVAADTLARFINDNPTIVILALGFLLMIGMTLIAEGFGAHVAKGYVYAAMAFSGVVEAINMFSRRAAARRKANRNPAQS